MCLNINLTNIIYVLHVQEENVLEETTGSFPNPSLSQIRSQSRALSVDLLSKRGGPRIISG